MTILLTSLSIAHLSHQLFLFKEVKIIQQDLLCVRYLSLSSYEYMSRMSRFNQSITAAHAGSAINPAIAQRVVRFLSIAQQAYHRISMLKILKNSHCSFWQKKSFFQTLPYSRNFSTIMHLKKNPITSLPILKTTKNSLSGYQYLWRFNIPNSLENHSLKNFFRASSYTVTLKIQHMWASSFSQSVTSKRRPKIRGFP